jgi:hypothetical protein
LEVRIRTMRKRGTKGGENDNKDKEKMRRMTRIKASILPNRGVSPVGRSAVAVVLCSSLSTFEARTDL